MLKPDSVWLYHLICEILVPWQGSIQAPQQWKHRVLTREPPGKSQRFYFIYKGQGWEVAELAE